MQEKFFNFAKEIAGFSDHIIKIGSIFVLKNSIISVGNNSEAKTHPLQYYYNIFRGFNRDNCHHYIHAELDALLKIRHFLTKGDISPKHIWLYNYREFKNGSLANSRPCKGCQKLLLDHGIKNWAYTINNGYAYEQR